MPITTKYLFVASMDVDPDKEELFNEVYDTEHIPNLLTVPGVHAVSRIKGEPFAVSIGGAEQQIAHGGPRYSALYERLTGRTCWSALPGPMRSNWAAGPARFDLTPAIASTRFIRSASDRQPCSRRMYRAAGGPCILASPLWGRHHTTRAAGGP